MSNVLFNTCLILPFIVLLISTEIQCTQTNETTAPPLRIARATTGQVVLSSLQECYRPCNGGDIRYCYTEFVIQEYMSMGSPCNACMTNSFERSNNRSSCECIPGDGFEKTMFPINRMFPGPPIQVCQHDVLVIDVKNEAEGTDTTIHWHGVFQKNSQYYDGVPHITQCPISAPNTFRYQFRVDNPGTHFYHSHAALYMMDGQQGPLIVRSPKNEDPNKDLYDEDTFDHVIFLSDWMHSVAIQHLPGTFAVNPGQTPDNFLINGLGQYKDPNTGETTGKNLTYYTVNPGRRYRFRMINSFATVCPVEMTIEGHKMIVIATDGEDIIPVVVDKIISLTGERYDFVLNANKSSGSYWIQLRGLGECVKKKISQVGVLIYVNQPSSPLTLPKTTRPSYDNPLIRNGVELNSLNANDCGSSKLTNNICINQLKSAKSTPVTEQKIFPDYRYYMSFGFDEYSQKIFTQGSQKPFFIANDRSLLISTVNNISYSEPGSPLISQYAGYEKICTAKDVSTCTTPCFCSQVLHMPKNKLIEVYLCDEYVTPDLNHPFHLHGYSFQVMAMKSFDKNRNSTVQERMQFLKEYDIGLQSGKYKQQARKDTLAVPPGGCVVIRFYTDNPGWWLFHCHFLWHTVTGMDIVVHVGEESDLPPVPANFPSCGNFLPEIYT